MVFCLASGSVSGRIFESRSDTICLLFTNKYLQTSSAKRHDLSDCIKVQIQEYDLPVEGGTVPNKLVVPIHVQKTSVNILLSEKSLRTL